MYKNRFRERKLRSDIGYDYESGFNEPIAPITECHEGSKSMPVFDEVPRLMILEKQNLQKVRRIQQERYSKHLELRRGIFEDGVARTKAHAMTGLSDERPESFSMAYYGNSILLHKTALFHLVSETNHGV